MRLGKTLTKNKIYTRIMNEIRNGYYRISVKALVLNDSRDKFLICEEESGVWELPGGGLDWGMTPQEDLPREIDEEMGLAVRKIADTPCYFITDQNIDKTVWFANVLYETELESLDFTPSDECVNIRFVDKNDLKDINAFPSVEKLGEMFNPANHQ